MDYIGIDADRNQRRLSELMVSATAGGEKVSPTRWTRAAQ
jgi:hypothetical protein